MQNKIFPYIIIVLITSIFVKAVANNRSDSYNISGTLKQYHTVVIDFTGPFCRSGDNSPNPFLDYRLQVEIISPSAKTYYVPGFFNGDGNGKNFGNIWSVRFTPLEKGKYTFRVSFQKGRHLAVKPLGENGQNISFDGVFGSFYVKDKGKNAKGFHKKGLLSSSGTHYFRFSDGTYWLKGGTNSPEDFLAYSGFSGTLASHDFSSHVQDWKRGDPDWNNGEGKGIIGALNYLAKQHVNSIYFLVMNIGGDGKNVWPFLSSGINPKGDPGNDNLHYDIEKLYQWDRVFAYAQNKSIFLHFVLSECEELNKKELDDAQLGIERKLFYREMIARFSHHLGLQWNLFEEYNLDFKLAPDLIKSCADYIYFIDPYKHPITVHHAGNVFDDWGPFIGDERFSVTSFQTKEIDVIEQFRKLSQDAGKPLVIGMDEFFPDVADGKNADRHRKEYIWPIYFSGGQMEFILDELLNTENFRKYEELWKFMWYARKFFKNYLPYQEMFPADSLLSEESTFKGNYGIYEGQVFMKKNDIYAVYLPVANKTGKLKVDTNGNYIQKWYNPRTGEFEGKNRKVKFLKNQEVIVGPPPSNPSQDWVILFSKSNK